MHHIVRPITRISDPGATDFTNLVEIYIPPNNYCALKLLVNCSWWIRWFSDVEVTITFHLFPLFVGSWSVRKHWIIPSCNYDNYKDAELQIFLNLFLRFCSPLLASRHPNFFLPLHHRWFVPNVRRTTTDWVTHVTKCLG